MNNNVKFRFIADPKLVDDYFRKKPGFLVAILDDFQILDTDAVSAITNESNATIKLPEKFSLHHNYPNPFNPETIISYDLPRSVNVSLIIYNTLGQEIITLVKEYQAAGRKIVKWNGKNRFGKIVPSGIYFYKLYADNFNSVKKMILQR